MPRSDLNSLKLFTLDARCRNSYVPKFLLKVKLAGVPPPSLLPLGIIHSLYSRHWWRRRGQFGNVRSFKSIFRFFSFPVSYEYIVFVLLLAINRNSLSFPYWSYGRQDTFACLAKSLPLGPTPPLKTPSIPFPPNLHRGQTYQAAFLPISANFVSIEA